MHSIRRVTTLMLNDCNAYHGILNHAEEYHVWKSSHECSARISADSHPTGWHGGDTKNMALKFVNKIIAKM